MTSPEIKRPPEAGGQPPAVGIDLGGTNIKAAFVGSGGRLLLRKEIPTEACKGPETVLERIASLARELAEEAGFSLTSLAGVGVGIPGLIGEEGYVAFSPNLGWEGVEAGKTLARLLPVPVRVENDANAAALGESLAGAGQGVDYLVVLTVGTGIGGGIILNGKLYRGASGAAGEIGHTIVLPDGPLCSCGNRGCLEVMTAAPAILRMTQEALQEGKTSLLSQVQDLEASQVFDAARQGDLLAREVVEQAGYYLGIGVANLSNILNPARVVIGGGVARAGELLLEPVRRTAQKLAFSRTGGPEILPAQLGNDAGVVGAAALVLEQCS